MRSRWFAYVPSKSSEPFRWLGASASGVSGTNRPHTGFNRVAQLGNGGAGSNSEATGWVNAMDFGRQTQQLGNLGTDGGQRVPAPKDVRGTSVMPSRAPNTTPMSPGTARYGNVNASTTAMSKATSKI
jgi:hypothetical protein